MEKLNVAIADDNEKMVEVLGQIIEEDKDLELVGKAHNGEEICNIIREKEPDVVVLDIIMPKMDGLSFLEHLKNLAPSVSVIMITASQNKESLRTALAHGVADYIIKPFTFERFKAALLTFAERWRLLHEAKDFDQSDLDNIFHRGAPPQQFSKGIDADTLEKILASVNAASAPVSTQEVADDVGLSRISVRKYLSYLEENNRIQGELSYGGKGRPVKLYRAL